MDIPWQQLQSDTLRALVEEFVSRDGTDYGEQECSQDFKIDQVFQMLRSGKIKLVFDSESESCNLLEVVRSPQSRP